MDVSQQPTVASLPGVRTTGRLQGRVSLVTGGASGIGRATASALAEEGSAVVIADLDVGAARETVEAISAGGGAAVALLSDVSSEDDAQAAVEVALRQFGRVDILVNNAGHVQLKPFLELTPADFDRMYEVHARGAFLFCQAVAPVMQEQGFGRIINISSGGGAGLGSPYATHYHAAKAAQAILADGVGRLGLDGVTVNTIVPGLVDTPLWRSDDADDGWRRAVGRSAQEEVERRVAGSRLGRPLRADEIAYVVVFLALPESLMINRQIIVVGD